MEHDPAVAGLYALVAPHAARLLGPHDPPKKVQVAVRFPDPSGRGPRPTLLRVLLTEGGGRLSMRCDLEL